jgi:Fe-S cluster biogenesis protein NfuA
MYAKGASSSIVNWYAAVFDSVSGINLIGGGSCTGCTMAYFAQNAGVEAIQPGDFVATQGVVVDPDLNVPVMQVVKATSAADPVIGVASSAMRRTPVGDYYGVKTGGFDAREGTAAAGEYLSVVVQGLVQARVDELQVQVGDKLTLQNSALEVASDGGVARAMSTPDENGMVWVLYNGQ